MLDQSMPSTPSRTERTSRILDTAVALLLRWGYQRVTIDDIAGEAGVGTGTIYLHWKNKEALFETVLLRELHTIWDILVRRLQDDPADVLLHRCLPALLQTVKERPLARALFTRDTVLLGKLTHSRLSRQSQQILGADAFLITLRQLGLMRTDVALDIQMHAFSAIWTGFMLIDSVVRPEEQAGLTTQHDALMQTVRDTFEPAILPDDATLRDVVAPQIIALFDGVRNYLAEQIDSKIIPRRTAVK